MKHSARLVFAFLPLAIVGLLISGCASPASQSPTYREACEKGTAADVRYFLNNGADPNMQFTETGGSVSALGLAAINPDVEVARTLLKAGADPQKRGKGENSALARAASANPNPEMLRLFIVRGADVNADSALAMALENNPNLDIARLLLDMGVAGYTTEYIFSNAIQNPNPGVVSWLADNGFFPKDGYYALARAAAVETERPGRFAEVLARVGDVDARDSGGRTLLMRLARGDDSMIRMPWARSEIIMQAILKAGGDINATDENGRTALWWSVLNRDPRATEFLLNAGANFQMADKDGWTPLALAIWNGSVKQVQLLLQKDASHTGPNRVSLFDVLNISRTNPEKKQEIARLLTGAKISQPRDETTEEWAVELWEPDTCESGHEFRTNLWRLSHKDHRFSLTTIKERIRSADGQVRIKDPEPVGRIVAQPPPVGQPESSKTSPLPQRRRAALPAQQ